MTLVAAVQALAARAAQEDKSIRQLMLARTGDTANLTTTATDLTGAVNEVKAIADAAALAASQGAIDDAATGTDTTWSSSKISSETDTRIAAVVGAAPAALDTLQEIAAELEADDTQAAGIIADLASKVGIVTQTFTAAQQAIARANIGAQSAADVGDTATDFVAAFEAALV